MIEVSLARHFLTDGHPGPFGQSCTQIRDSLDASLKRDSSVIDWMFPADTFSAPNSTAPSLTPGQVQVIIDDRWSRASLRQNYVRWVATRGMAVDHHGWLYLDSKTCTPDKANEHAKLIAREVPRVLRFLAMSGLSGYSRSGFEDPAGFLYAAGLVDFLAKHLAPRAPSLLPHLAGWRAIRAAANPPRRVWQGPI